MFASFRLIFIIVCLVINLQASTYKSNLKQYNKARKSYVRIIGHNDNKKEIIYLKRLIFYGKKLKKNVNRYKKELNRIKRKKKKSSLKSIKYKKNKKVKPKYSIGSVTQKDNKIFINFNKRISKKDIRYFTKKSRYAHQYIFDIKGRFKDARPTKLSITGVNKVKIIQYRFDTLRIIATNKTIIKPIYILQNKTIILKLTKSNKAKLKKYNKYIAKKSDNYYRLDKKIIVIDAGHGGKDTGAIGPKRRYEKNVVLSISKYLYKILKNNGYSVYLTRNRDVYISLRYRTRLANRRNANMFISIHANATKRSRAKEARGIETYFLSPARSQRAKRVAAKENKTDLASMGWQSKSIFLTVLNRGKITASNKIAIDIQKNMLYYLRKKYGNNTIKDGGVREGPFWVLVGAQMPSVLIEVGYISHPKESKRICSSTYQKLIAKSIAKGVTSYFLKNK